uniref:DUF642 domain-containing protein n=1 Tax=Ananas comosus var. bracteatus TaxID=296719 RepID=A0A6V7PU92_ANACO|nr:unnamed protein product [Ananas comosus var. bracteatus]
MVRSSTRTICLFLMPLQLLLLLLLLSQMASAAVEDGLLTNGDFETAPAGGFASFAVGEGVTSIPGWTINGTVELISSGQRQGGMILIVPQGEHAVRLGNEAGIAQSVAVEKGAEYSVTFSAARTCAQLETLNRRGVDAYAWAFQAADDGAARLAFRNPGMEEDPTCGPILDNVAIKKLFTPDPPKGAVGVPNATLGVLLPTNLDESTSSLPGWTVESNRAVRYVDAAHFSVPGGKRAVELLSGKEGIISQMVATTPAKNYALTFTLGAAGDACQAPLAVMAFAADQTGAFHYSRRGTPPAISPTSPSSPAPTAPASPSTASTTTPAATTTARCAGLSSTMSGCGPVPSHRRRPLQPCRPRPRSRAAALIFV